MKHDAIVLLGFSGVGKDTSFTELDKRYPSKFTNTKFGSMSKSIVAKAFDIDVSELEDKQLRKQPRHNWCGLSPLGLLTVLYKGITPEMTKAHLAYTLSSVNHDCIPVFTDIRRRDEADTVYLNYSRPLFVYLWSREVSEGINDGFVENVAFAYNAKVICRDGLTVTDVVNTIEGYLNEN